MHPQDELVASLLELCREAEENPPTQGTSYTYEEGLEIVEEQRRAQAKLFRDVRDARLARALRSSAIARCAGGTQLARIQSGRAPRSRRTKSAAASRGDPDPESDPPRVAGDDRLEVLVRRLWAHELRRIGSKRVAA